MRRLGGLLIALFIVGALASPAGARDAAQGAAHVQIAAQAQRIADGLAEDGWPVFGVSSPPGYMWMYNGNWYGRAWVSWAMPAFEGSPAWFHLDVYDCGAWIGCAARADLSSHSGG